MCQMCHGFSKKPQGRCFSPCSKQGCGVTEASDEVDELVDLGVCVCVCVCVCGVEERGGSWGLFTTLQL